MISTAEAQELLDEAYAVEADAGDLQGRGVTLANIESLWSGAYDIMVRAQKVIGRLIDLRPIPLGEEPEVFPAAALEALRLATRALSIAESTFRNCRDVREHL